LGCWPRRSKPSSSTVSSLSSLLSEKHNNACLMFVLVWKKSCFRHRPHFSFVSLGWKIFYWFYCLQFCIMLWNKSDDTFEMKTDAHMGYKGGTKWRPKKKNEITQKSCFQKPWFLTRVHLRSFTTYTK
jgi:hypothetical protein